MYTLLKDNFVTTWRLLVLNRDTEFSQILSNYRNFLDVNFFSANWKNSENMKIVAKFSCNRVTGGTFKCLFNANCCIWR